MAGERRLPGLGLYGYWNQGSTGWKPGMDENLSMLSILVDGTVKSRTTALPGSPANGDTYIVPAAASTNANSIAARDNGAWFFIPPKKGVRLFVESDGTFVYWNGTDWIEESAGEVYTFLGLTDTPVAFGTAGQVLAVNVLGTGLDFVDPPSGGGGGGGGIEEAPEDGTPYARQDAGWVAVTTGGGGSDGGVRVRYPTATTWRLEVTAEQGSGAGMRLSEILFIDENGDQIDASVATITGSTVSESDTSKVPANVFDGDPATYFRSNEIPTGGAPIFLQAVFADPISVSEVRMATTDNLAGSPKDFKLKADGVVVLTVTASPAWVDQVYKVYPFEADVAPYVAGKGVETIVRLTQAEYDALTAPDDLTLYVVID